MTPQQQATLKAALLADPALAQYIIDYRDDLIRDYYNAPSSPAFTVWRTSVTQDEIMQNGFDWVQVDNLSVGKARIWEWLFDNSSTSINPSKANVRAGIDEAWKGTAAMLAVRAAVYVHCKRVANRVERIFATGTGSDAVPGVLTFEGELTTSDVSAMLSGER
jgi:hypothetical protein